MTAFLGVERSATGRRWEARACDERLALALSQRLAAPDLVGRVLAGRQVAVADAEWFLAPRLREALPDPSHLRDMDAAAERIARAVAEGEPIAVFGDYDVDGAASAALIARFLAAVGRPARIYIPDRINEGYGPNTAALRLLAAEGARLVITVDCGTAAFAPLAAAREFGLDTIVVDHHLAEPELPPALAVVNPNRLDEASDCRHLAAAGVAFLVLVAVNRRLRQTGFYRGRPEPSLLQWLDLVALATVCDAVPLTGLNRGFVAQGLRVLAERRNTGLAALADAAGLRQRATAYHLGFVLGPRINAGGRMGDAGLGARLLTTDDPAEASSIAATLDQQNRARRRVEAEVLAAAGRQAELAAERDDPVIVACGEGWHPGVLGIVAARLVERHDRPCFAIGLDDGVGKGSGRSVPGVALGAAVIEARRRGLIAAGGGHDMAAGLTVAAERIGPLRDFLAERVGPQLPERAVLRRLLIDGAVSVAGANAALLEMLDRIGPYGNGHAEPRFAVPAARLRFVDVVGERHLRLRLSDGGDGTLNAIAFNAVDTDLGGELLRAQGEPLHLAGWLRADARGGGTCLVVGDAAPAA